MLIPISPHFLLSSLLGSFPEHWVGFLCYTVGMSLVIYFMQGINRAYIFCGDTIQSTKPILVCSMGEPELIQQEDSEISVSLFILKTCINSRITICPSCIFEKWKILYSLS